MSKDNLFFFTGLIAQPFIITYLKLNVSMQKQSRFVFALKYPHFLCNNMFFYVFYFVINYANVLFEDKVISLTKVSPHEWVMI